MIISRVQILLKKIEKHSSRKTLITVHLLKPDIGLFLQGYTYEEQVKHFETYQKMLPFDLIMFLPLVNIHAHHGDGRNGCMGVWKHIILQQGYSLL